jgi:hypothetical protein
MKSESNPNLYRGLTFNNRFTYTIFNEFRNIMPESICIT